MDMNEYIRQPIIDNPNANIIRMKVYSNEHHIRKKLHQGHMMDFNSSEKKAKKRYNVLRDIISELRNKKCTCLRTEITSVLSPLA
jgi:hypothetical protein